MEQQVVVITGASSGIGAGLAERLASEGKTVVLVARRREALEDVASRCGGRGHVAPADVSRREEVRRVVDETLKRFGRIDVWVNNAGLGITKMPSQLTDEDVDLMMQVNVKSAMYGMQEVLPHFQSKNAGQIINVSSMLGRVPLAPFRSAYCGAKHFLNALTASLRTEVQQTHPGIQIALVSPGVVYTEFGKNAVHGGPDSRQLPGGQTVEEVTAVLADAIARPRPDVYTRSGSKAQVAQYLDALTADPA
jgi:short-subunit dehydrogenase